ncbi:hypothetical protein FG93_01865 [Bosea sp. LC85]|uniref:hypothetical protein n=1 Tax=Bosea sp. LC85 TaxID=1502851 RepID=UPI0004E2BFEA|nr:hypothetical protein [Bosea sp. LC85]KFC73122.1 hypothetical protein FG93_01865 [Bosea sp. LC85]
MAKAATKISPAAQSLRKEQAEQRRAKRRKGKDADLNEALDETFPASDPVALESPTKTGPATRT